MRATRRSLLLATPILSTLGALLAGCGTSTFSSDGDAASVADAGADVAPDSVIIVSPQDGSSADGDSAAADATSGVADASHDAVSSDHLAPHDATADSMADAGQASGNDAADAGPPFDSGGDTTQAAGDAATDGPAEAEAGTGITVAGHAVVNADAYYFITTTTPLALTATPLAFRAIGLRDAAGKVLTTSTDATGAFQFAGVTPPYDAVVYAGDPTGSPYVYLGLSTAHPRLAGWVTHTSRSANVDLTVQFQDCGASTCRCAVLYWFPDIAEYEGVGCGSVTPGQTWKPNPAIGWLGPASIAADLHILEWDPQSQHFWYASATGIALSANQTTTVGTLVPTSVPTAGTMTVNATTTGVPASWTPQASIGIGFPNADVSQSLMNPAPAPITSGLPLIAGATANAGVSASYTTSFLQEAITYAATRSLPLSTSSIALTLNPAVAVTSPSANGAVSRNGGSLAWSPVAPQQVYTASLTPYTDSDAGPILGTTEVWVFTSSSSIDLGRIAALSVTAAVQPTWLQLTAEGQVASLDAMLDEQTLAKPDGSHGSWVALPFNLTP